eukprot:TRINITY_DN4199_c0_g1_i2.p1 TRINITY_DN4199_c0_g1~~TRINITY_DN4199_c0_g1_i2.p1  ORF type:complete len:128 (-),score=0.71 TRINITY_DN4199_c0_g1_i2:410-793(-)
MPLSNGMRHNKSALPSPDSRPSSESAPCQLGAIHHPLPARRNPIIRAPNGDSLSFDAQLRRLVDALAHSPMAAILSHFCSKIIAHPAQPCRYGDVAPSGGKLIHSPTASLWRLTGSTHCISGFCSLV